MNRLRNIILGIGWEVAFCGGVIAAAFCVTAVIFLLFNKPGN